ncbi:NADH-quinone oxidoreductase subunit J [Pikeienuella sp. HZG-20]|uniref:NADH-quinone oxidoreductase subunit J n=1 Tax=Paludibacillus litoralis TaxID=3133267 RepID=UPI0030EEE15A
MALIAIAFYLFATVTIVAGLMVTVARNPVHSVLWLILAFFSAACMFVLMGAEFVAMILLIVYVGAVAVLFLFVVMMLDVDFQELRRGVANYLPVGVMIGVVLLLELSLVFANWLFAPEAPAQRVAEAPAPETVENTLALGRLLYTDYVYFFQLAGVILFVAMIGAIVLTLRPRDGVKRQDATVQIWRRRSEAVELKDVKPGQGI